MPSPAPSRTPPPTITALRTVTPVPTATLVPTLTPPATASAPATLTPTGPPLAVRLDGPADGSVVSGLVEVTGSASGVGGTATGAGALADAPGAAGRRGWRVELRPAGGRAWQLLAQGTGGAVGAALDAQRLPNGLYEVRLSAADAAGRVASTSRFFVASGASRVGAYRHEVTDVEGPGAGLGAGLVRRYDSRSAEPGDFGRGWSLAVAEGGVGASGPLGAGWELAPGPGGAQCLQPVRPHVVALTLADERVLRFRPVVERPCAQGAPPEIVSVVYEPLDSPATTLAPAGEVYVDYLGGAGSSGAPAPGAARSVELLDFATALPLDPQRYEVALPDGTRLVVRPGSGVERATDPQGRWVVVERNAITSSAGLRVRLERDGGGRVTRAVDVAGNAVRYEYDPAGGLRSAVDREGHATSYGYDGTGKLSAIVDPIGNAVARLEYDAGGRIAAVTDAAGLPTSYAYDPGLRQRLTTDRRGGVTVETFGPTGERLTRRDPEGRETRFSGPAQPVAGVPLALAGVPTSLPAVGIRSARDVAMLPDLRARTAPGSGESGGQGQGRPAEGLDRNGRVVHRTEGGRLTHYAYDPAGRLTTETGPGGETRYTYDALGRLVEASGPEGALRRWYYDGEGNPVATVDASGRVTQLAYDRSHRLVQVTYADGSGTRREYDAAGRLSRTVDAAGAVTRYGHDETGRQVTVVDPLGAATRLEHDDAGNLTALTDAAGRVTRFEYAPDPRSSSGHQLTRTVLPDGSTSGAHGAPGVPPGARFELDGQGRRVGAVDGAGRRFRFGYDADGRLAELTLPSGGTESLTFDPAGLPDTLTTANGDLFLFRRDRAGRIVERTWPDNTSETFSYSPDGALERVAGAWGATTVLREPATGRLARVTLADGRYVRYEHDSRGLLTLVAHATVAGAPEARTRYAYDAAGRVVEVDGEGGIVRLAYDAAGNRTSVARPNGVTSVYRYDVRDRVVGAEHRARDGRLLASASPTNDVTAGPPATVQPAPGPADGAGNRTAVEGPAGSTRLVYDGAGRLARLEFPMGRTVAFAYSPSGHRQGRSDTAGTVYSLVDERAGGASGRVLRESDRSGATSRVFTYLPDGAVPVSWSDAEGTVFPLDDGSGTVHALVDAAGRVVASYSVRPDAPPVSTNAAGAPGPVYWRGERLDAEAGILVFGDGRMVEAHSGARLNALTGWPIEDAALALSGRRRYDGAVYGR